MSTPEADPTPAADPIRAARAELERPGVLPADRAEAGPGERAGDAIGRYKLLQEIGEGGFGVVWMAEQTEPVRRKVALKVIKLGMDTRQVVARFEAERQALALMDHPHIAKVLDGGATASGRPYFVMELVKGVPITEFCDRAKLGVRGRLELFAKVCSAVQHAHTKGVIHRDIKPSNLLVTLHDGEPVPKVIDFGIAKATSAELTQKTLFTEFRQMIGTPEYMAPEQAELSGLDVDTRADVYSLGVVLYELLTGTKPFDMRTVLEKGYQELLRTIREEEPPLPSTRVSTLGDSSTQIELLRGSEPGRLGLALRGDLDWIVMRALEKDRTRRYETASELGQDVRRYLADEPVSATPPSALYRLRKLVRRHRAATLGAAGVLLALLLGIAGTTSAMLRAVRSETDAVAAAEREREAREAEAAQRGEAEEQRRAALEQAELARAATRSAEEQRAAAERESARALEAERIARDRFDGVRGLARVMLSDVEPRLRNLPGTLPARQVLFESVLMYLDGLGVDASDDETLRAEVGDVYLMLGELLGDPFSGEAVGDFEGALEANLAGLEIRRELAAAHPDEAWRRANVVAAEDFVASSLSNLGRYEEALAYRLSALEGARELAHQSGWQQRLANLMQRRLGNHYVNQGRYAEALDQFFPLHESLRLQPCDPERDSEDSLHSLVVSYHQMSQCWHGQGELDLALSDSAESLSLCRALVRRFDANPRHARDLAGRLYAHALILVDLGRVDEALATLGECEEVARDLYRRDATNGLAARSFLGRLFDLGELRAELAERDDLDAPRRAEQRERAAALLAEGLELLPRLRRGELRAWVEQRYPPERVAELSALLDGLRG